MLWLKCCKPQLEFLKNLSNEPCITTSGIKNGERITNNKSAMAKLLVVALILVAAVGGVAGAYYLSLP
jgi:hypothetical protein